MTETATIENLEQIDLDSIVYAVDNHRESMDPQKLQELADSIAAIGVQQPVKVCRRDSGNVLIFGHRRVAAAGIAGLATVPAMVVTDWTDEQIAEAQVIENILREDLNPVEEARCVRTLMSAGQDLEAAAAKMNKSESWARRRLDLLRLDASLLPFVASGRLPLSHAVLISRVGSHDDQVALARSAMGVFWNSTLDEAHETDYITPLKEVRKEIKWKLCKMGSARWPHIGEYAERRPCAGCPDNTNTEPGLFESLGIEQTSNKGNCTNPECFKAKAEAWENDPERIAKQKARDAKKAEKAASQDEAPQAGSTSGEGYRDRQKRIKQLKKQFPWTNEQRLAVATFDYGQRLVEIVGQYLEAAELSADVERDLVLAVLLPLTGGARQSIPCLRSIASGKARVKPSLIAEAWRRRKMFHWRPGIDYAGEVENVPLDERMMERIDELEAVVHALEIDNLPSRPTVEQIEQDALRETIVKGKRDDALKAIAECEDVDMLMQLRAAFDAGELKLPKYKLEAIESREARLIVLDDEADEKAYPTCSVCGEQSDIEQAVCSTCYELMLHGPKKRQDEVAAAVAKAPLWLLEELEAEGLSGDWRRKAVRNRIAELKDGGEA